MLIAIMIVAICLPLVAYAKIELDKNVSTEKNEDPSSAVIKFDVVVNGMKNIEVYVCVNLSDGLTEKEAELIAGITFIHVKGEYVWRRLDTLTFDDTQIQANYIWGCSKTDLGHIYNMTADLTTLQITVDHCL